MFESYYKLEITGKDVKRFIKMLYKMGIYFEEIYFDNSSCFVKVDLVNYKKISDIKTSYNIKIVGLYGGKKFEVFFKRNFHFFFFSCVGVLLLYFLSNIIFDVEIIHDDKNIREILTKELEKYDIEKYKFVKSYDYIQKVKEEILNNNKEDIEWLEFERVGSTYKVRVDKRVINNIKKEDDLKHIVAKKPGIIMKIVAEKGEVVKKVTDYVKEGDIIISGDIYRNHEVIDHVSAEGAVFAEVWYKVKIEMPINYKEEKLTGRSKNVINVKFLSSSWNLFDFDKYQDKKINENVLFSDFFGLFKISYNEEYEVIIKDEVNNIISEEFSLKIARNKVEENLKDGEYIISQKKLKTVINNSTIVTEVFFKVYENISSYKYYSIEEG